MAGLRWGDGANPEIFYFELFFRDRNAPSPRRHLVYLKVAPPSQIPEAMYGWKHYSGYRRPHGCHRRGGRGSYCEICKVSKKAGTVVRISLYIAKTTVGSVGTFIYHWDRIRITFG